MAVTQYAKDDQALTLDTPATLATITSAGVYELRLDCNALVADDILFVRVYEIFQTVAQGGTERLTEEWGVFGTTLINKNVRTPPIVCLNSVKFVLEQTDGTGRTIPWEIAQIQ